MFFRCFYFSFKIFLAETETWRTLNNLPMLKSWNKLGNVLLYGLKFNSKMKREKKELKLAIEFCKTTDLNATYYYLSQLFNSFLFVLFVLHDLLI